MTNLSQLLIRSLLRKDWRPPFSIEPPGLTARKDTVAVFIIRDYDGYPMLRFSRFELALEALNALEARYTVAPTSLDAARFHYDAVVRERAEAHAVAVERNRHYWSHHQRLLRRIGPDERKRWDD